MACRRRRGRQLRRAQSQPPPSRNYPVIQQRPAGDWPALAADWARLAVWLGGSTLPPSSPAPLLWAEPAAALYPPSLTVFSRSTAVHPPRPRLPSELCCRQTRAWRAEVVLTSTASRNCRSRGSHLPSSPPPITVPGSRLLPSFLLGLSALLASPCILASTCILALATDVMTTAQPASTRPPSTPTPGAMDRRSSALEQYRVSLPTASAGPPDKLSLASRPIHSPRAS